MSIIDTLITRALKNGASYTAERLIFNIKEPIVATVSMENVRIDIFEEGISNEERLLRNT